MYNPEILETPDTQDTGGISQTNTKTQHITENVKYEQHEWIQVPLEG
jgi:hypothetical protein